MKRALAWAFLLAAGICGAADPVVRLPARVRGLDLSAAESIPVLSGGRAQPLLVRAAEGVRGIRDRDGLSGEVGPMASWFALCFFPDSLASQEIVWFPQRSLRARVGLDPAGKFASFRGLAANGAFLAILAEANERAARSERLDAVHRAAREAGRRLELFAEAGSGEAWRLLPGPRGREGAWRTPQEVQASEVPADPLLRERLDALDRLSRAYRSGNQTEFDRAARELASTPLLDDRYAAAGGGASLRARPSHIAAELALYRFRPFRAGWILFLLSSLLAWFSVPEPARRGRLVRAAVVSAALGFLALAGGFALRVYVSGRPPVANMYETMLWAGLGVVAIGLAVFRSGRSPAVLSAAAAAGCALLVMADNLPSVLDPAIRPLVPVLRSDFWLTLHVLTVTLSYAAFLLASALGNAGLAGEFRATPDDGFRRDLAGWAHRSMLLGVLLLTAGILLGGVWADRTWGRFWGWDPKETWSLVADLGYLAVLHGRISGRLGTFGTLAGAVLAFYGVVMAWFGVNFILASGLHSYGFSSGGATGVAVFAVVQGTFLAVAWSRRGWRSRCAS